MMFAPGSGDKQLLAVAVIVLALFGIVCIVVAFT